MQKLDSIEMVIDANYGLYEQSFPIWLWFRQEYLVVH